MSLNAIEFLSCNSNMNVPHVPLHLLLAIHPSWVIVKPDMPAQQAQGRHHIQRAYTSQGVLVLYAAEWDQRPPEDILVPSSYATG